MIQALGHVRCIGIHMRSEPCHVQLGRCQQRAQFVMQLTREVAALFFAHLLQVCGQLAERSCSIAHELLQLVALMRLRFLFSIADFLQRLGLAQIHVEGKQTDGGHGQDADAREPQRMHDGGVAVFGALDRALDHALRGGADGLHVLEPDVGGHHELPGILVAVAAQLQAQIQFGQPAGNLVGQIGEIAVVFGKLPQQAVQSGDAGVDRFGAFGVGLYVLRIARQKIAAQSAFQAEHFTQQTVQRTASALGLFQSLNGGVGTDVSGLIDGDQHHRGKHCQQHVEGHFRERKLAHEC